MTQAVGVGAHPAGAPDSTGASAPPSRVLLGDFEVDLRNRELHRDGERISIQDLPFEVLAHLLRTPGELVPRESLREALWPDVTFMDWDQGLHTAARKLRDALGDDARSPRYVETVPRRGYRLIAPVRPVEPEDPEEPEAFELAALPPAPSAAPETVLRVPAPPAGRRLRAGVLLALTLGACMAFLLAFDRRAASPFAADAFREVSIHPVNDPGAAGALTLVSPDGHYVLLSAPTLDGHPMWLEQRATGALHPVSQSDLPYAGVELSPSGEWVYFTLVDAMKPMLYRQALVGGPAEEALPGVTGFFALSPDGRQVAHLVARAGESVLVIDDLETARRRELARFSPGEDPWMPKWSPDGRWIAFTVTESTGSRVVRVATGDGGRQAVSSLGWDAIGAKVWLPDGSGLLMVGRRPGEADSVWLVGSEGSGERRIAGGSLDDFSPWSLGLTADGRTLSGAIAYHRGTLWDSWPDESGEERMLSQDWHRPIQLLNGGRLLCRLGSQESRMWILDPGRPEIRQQLTAADRDLDAAVSPDGRTVVYLSDRAGVTELWRVSSEGGPPSRLTHGLMAYSPVVSADGRSVYFLSAFKNDLWRVPMAGGEPVRVAPGSLDALAASPDGRWLATWHRDTPGQRFELELLPVAGGAPRRIELPDTANRQGVLHWTPDSHGVLYVDRREHFSNLWRVSIDGGPPTPFTHFRRADLDPIEDFALRPDGSLVIGRGRWHFRPVLVDDATGHRNRLAGLWPWMGNRR